MFSWEGLSHVVCSAFAFSNIGRARCAWSCAQTAIANSLIPHWWCDICQMQCDLVHYLFHFMPKVANSK